MSQLWLRPCQSSRRPSWIMSRSLLLHRRTFAKDLDKSKKKIGDLIKQSDEGKLSHKASIPKSVSRAKHMAHLPPVRGRQKHPNLGRDHDPATELLMEPAMGLTAAGAPSKLDMEALGNYLGDGTGGGGGASSSLTHSELISKLLEDHYDDPDDKYYWVEALYDPGMQDDDSVKLPDSDSSDDEDEDGHEAKLVAGDAEDLGMDLPTEATEELSAFPKVKAEGNIAYAHNDPRAIQYEKENDILEILADRNYKSPIEGMNKEQRMEYWKNMYTVGDGINFHELGPSKNVYDSIFYVVPHPDETREPTPLGTKRGIRPTKEFLQKHLRFLYVSNLPPEVDLEGKPVDIKNPVNFHHMQRKIGDIVEVDSSRVFPTTPSAGFVGFADLVEYVMTLHFGPHSPDMFRPPILKRVEHESEFFQESPESTLLLEFLPHKRHTSASLARELFHADSDLEGSYGNVQPSDIFFLSASSALIRFGSKEQADSALSSGKVVFYLENVIGKYRVRYQAARRYLVHKGYTGPPDSKSKYVRKFREVRKLSDLLIVDGDMPTRKFYRSHAGVLSLRNLDTTVTVRDLTIFFQPFSVRPRDTTSIEFVKDAEGNTVGHAYVGFDVPGEAERAWGAIKQNPPRFAGRPVVLNLVKDRRFPYCKYKGIDARPERDIDTLLDDVNNWKRYVDPKDLELLAKYGVTEYTLSESLRYIRFFNPTMGHLDYAKRNESIEPQKEKGQLYKDLVTEFITTLKECLPTPENPGALYEAIHPPGVPPDLDFYHSELERVKKIQEERAAKYS